MKNDKFRSFFWFARKYLKELRVLLTVSNTIQKGWSGWFCLFYYIDPWIFHLTVLLWQEKLIWRISDDNSVWETHCSIQWFRNWETNVTKYFADNWTHQLFLGSLYKITNSLLTIVNAFASKYALETHFAECMIY